MKPLSASRLKKLHSAFDLVRNAQDWKMPIDALVKADDLKKINPDFISEAIIHFTGTFPEVSLYKNGDAKFIAAGYYQMESEFYQDCF